MIDWNKEKITKLGSLGPEESLRFLAEEFPGGVVFTTSFGAEDQVITDFILKNKLPIRIISLDTGRLFPETYELHSKTLAKYGATIETYYPDALELGNFVSIHGPNSFYDSVENRKECCRIRKVVPLKRALIGAKVWITGIRKDQSSDRDGLSFWENDNTNQVYKFHPIISWSFEDVLAYLKSNQVPYNPLHEKGFPSIGCAPCTRAIQPGEDFRAGRWWWETESNKECGIHFVNGKVVRTGKKEISSFGTDGTSGDRPHSARVLSHLDKLEAESIHILREVAAQFDRPVLLFSGGKDSITIVHLAIKAFQPAKVPFTLVHIDTGHNFPEALDYRDNLVKKYDLKLVVGSVQDSIDRGKAVEEKGKFPSRNAIQTVTLLETISQLKADACIGGARRDEEKARAKERIFSVRDVFGAWDPRLQRPELWDLYNGRIHNGENVRVFPISNWTELDVWEYIRRENIELPSLYFSHYREVIWRDGLLFPTSEFIRIDPEDQVENRIVRFRTVGDMTCTAAVDSEANSIDEIIREIRESKTTERGSRLDDKRSEAAMEERKRGGYF
jgi:sulfate adenylyltransferase subunit 2